MKNLSAAALSFLTGPSVAGAAARSALAPLSWAYGAAAGLAARRALAHRTPPLPVPVISIGQIHSGGMGKTPFVITLAGALADRGKRVGIVLRGYGGTASAAGALVAKEGDILISSREAGDEAIEIARALSGGEVPVAVAVGADRSAAARRLLDSTRADVLLLDDAFQHRKIPRDLDVVLLPADAAPSRERLLPAGPLREGYEALGRAGIVVVNRLPRGVAMTADLAGRLPPRAEIFTARARPVAIRPWGGTTDPVVPMDRPVLLLCGIANPSAFAETAAMTGARVVGRLEYPDHHFYDAHDLERIAGAFEAHHAAFVMTTEKDAARLPRSLPFPCGVLTIRIEVDAPDDPSGGDWVARILARATRQVAARIRVVE